MSSRGLRCSPTRPTDSIPILEHILIGTPASPLRNNSGLGEDIVGRGLDDELLQPMLSVGLKGIDPSGAEKVEAHVLETLRALASKGIDRVTIEASLNTVEFRLRENNFGSFSRRRCTRSKRALRKAHLISRT
jgi:presequence protease